MSIMGLEAFDSTAYKADTGLGVSEEGRGGILWQQPRWRI